MMLVLYRRYLKAGRIFHRLMPWLWLTGIGYCLIGALTGISRRWIEAGCLLTLYPAMIGWFLFNGLGIVIGLRVVARLGLSRPTLASAAFAVVLLLLGATLVVGGLRLLVVVLQKSFE